MSVLTCDRYGCSNIMCDHTILGQYYICDDCLAELQYLKSSLPNNASDEEIREAIKGFMANWKNIDENDGQESSFDRVLNLRSRSEE
jgi:hypothetical protein